MPDWSYRTVFQPLLFRLPPARARDLALGFLGRVAAAPLGGALIDFLGHMRPDPRLRTQLGPLTLAGPVIIGPHLDVHLAGARALSRFGVGMIEIGPVTRSPPAAAEPIERDDDSRSLRQPCDLATLTAEQAAETLARLQLSAPVMVRLAADADADSIARLAPYAAAFSADLQSLERSAVASAAGETGLPLFASVPADLHGELPSLLVRGRAAGVAGIVIDGRIQGERGTCLVGGAALAPAAKAIGQVRKVMGSDFPIIAGGVVVPAQAMQLLAAGADAVQVDVGMYFSGPGLCKRINDAVLFSRCQVVGTLRVPSPAATPQTVAPSPAANGTRSVPTTWEDHPAAMSWFWAFLLALAMLLGGAMALAIAVTRVLLPYDEAYLGMTADELRQINPRLLPFMTHDRVTLAGTMLTVGIQFGCLAWFGIRRGQHWAKMSVLAAAFAGFFTFFLFLGFGYFDPFHAFVTAINFQFVLFALAGRLGPADPPPHPNLHDDRRWRMAQWGQLLLLVHAAAVIVAGATICTIGSTSVFVAEDLAFLQTTAEALHEANPRLVPVVAHDRASFGGMLLAVGIATLLPVLWGIRQGAMWLWWMFALSATVGYATTLAVHLAVGYTDLAHLAPALGGLALHWLALSLLFPYMKPATAQDAQEWEALLARKP